MTTRHWTQKRKAKLCDRILDGELTIEQAVAEVGPGTSEEEVQSWVDAYSKSRRKITALGLRALHERRAQFR